MEKNYAIKSMGPWAQVAGKTFLGEDLNLVGAQASVQKLAAGEDAPFFHAHKTHEELYIIVSGEGEYEVDGEKNPVKEGDFIKVAPAGVRALRNTGKTEMVMICVQFENKAITSFMEDGIIIEKK